MEESESLVADVEMPPIFSLSPELPSLDEAPVPPPPEEPYIPPPPPQEAAPLPNESPPISPLSSSQMSNVGAQWLDFETDAGGQITTKLCSEVGTRQEKQMKEKPTIEKGPVSKSVSEVGTNQVKGIRDEPAVKDKPASKYVSEVSTHQVKQIRDEPAEEKKSVSKSVVEVRACQSKRMKDEQSEEEEHASKSASETNTYQVKQMKDEPAVEEKRACNSVSEVSIRQVKRMRDEPAEEEEPVSKSVRLMPDVSDSDCNGDSMEEGEIVDESELLGNIEESAVKPILVTTNEDSLKPLSSLCHVKSPGGNSDGDIAVSAASTLNSSNADLGNSICSKMETANYKSHETSCPGKLVPSTTAVVDVLSDTQENCEDKDDGLDAESDGMMDNGPFDIIDDTESEDDNITSIVDDLDDDSEYEVDVTEIDAMLDENMHDYKRLKADGLTEEDGPVIKSKVILKEKVYDPFDVLPEGWVTISHHSGMPVYLHRPTRVCTMSRPYFLGSGSARKHDIPISAIPCLQYQRAIKREERQSLAEDLPCENNSLPEASQPAKTLEALPPPANPENDNTVDVKPDVEAMEMSAVTGQTEIKEENGDDGTDDPSGAGQAVRIESVEDSKKLNNLTATDVRDYCEHLFEFETVDVKRFKTWKARRKHTMQSKKVARPSLPADTKLITCPIVAENGKSKKVREFLLNPTGKSHVCILHEYVQHALRVQPRYVFKENENSTTPYSATIVIGDVEYGTGKANSKKAAKSEAARITLGILIPEYERLLQNQQSSTSPNDFAFFDEVKITDPRVSELSSLAGHPKPFSVLNDCLKRNYGLGNTVVKMEMKSLKHQKGEFIMCVGKHEAKVICKNKREGKQQAAQAILQMLHPNVLSWGSLLRLYGTSQTAKVTEEPRVIDLQTKCSRTKPNTAILQRLRSEMVHLSKARKSISENVKGKLDMGEVRVTANPNRVGGLDL